MRDTKKKLANAKVENMKGSKEFREGYDAGFSGKARTNPYHNNTNHSATPEQQGDWLTGYVYGSNAKAQNKPHMYENASAPVSMNGKQYRPTGPSMGNQLGKWEFEGPYGWKEVINLSIRKKLDQKFNNAAGEKLYKITSAKGNLVGRVGLETAKKIHGSQIESVDEKTQVIILKSSSPYGNAFQNGCSKATKEIENKAKAAGLKLGNGMAWGMTPTKLFEEGKNAFKAGSKRADNPYQDHPQESKHWNRGWDAGKSGY